MTSITQYHDVRQYDERIIHALQELQLEERIPIYDNYGRSTGHVVSLRTAHSLGLIHRTSDVILIRSDNHVLLQRRSKSDDTFANRYGCSAGGHIECEETPKQAAVRELKEEIGLVLDDPGRLVPLHDMVQGLPIYYLKYVYRCKSGSLTAKRSKLQDIFKFDVPPSLQKMNLSEFVPALDRCPSWAPPLKLGKSLCLDHVFFNQEWTFYYALAIFPCEEEQLSSNPYEVQDMVWVSLDKAEMIAEDPLLSTDSLKCLYHNGVFDYLRGASMRWM